MQNTEMKARSSVLFPVALSGCHTLVSDVQGRTQAEGVREWRAEGVT